MGRPNRDPNVERRTLLSKQQVRNKIRKLYAKHGLKAIKSRAAERKDHLLMYSARFHYDTWGDAVNDTFMGIDYCRDIGRRGLQTKPDIPRVMRDFFVFRRQYLRINPRSIQLKERRLYKEVQLLIYKYKEFTDWEDFYAVVGEDGKAILNDAYARKKANLGFPRRWSKDVLKGFVIERAYHQKELRGRSIVEEVRNYASLVARYWRSEPKLLNAVCDELEQRVREEIKEADPDNQPKTIDQLLDYYYTYNPENRDIEELKSYGAREKRLYFAKRHGFETRQKEELVCLAESKTFPEVARDSRGKDEKYVIERYQRFVKHLRKYGYLALMLAKLHTQMLRAKGLSKKEILAMMRQEPLKEDEKKDLFATDEQREKTDKTQFFTPEIYRMSDILADGPKHYRNVINLRLFYGLTREETAIILGLKPGTVDGYFSLAKTYVEERM